VYSNNNYSGKYCAVFDSQLSGLTEEPVYRGSDYRVPGITDPNYFFLAQPGFFRFCSLL